VRLIKKLILTLLFLGVATSAYSSSAFLVNDQHNYHLARQVDYLFDESMSLDLDSARQSNSWQPVARNTVNFGFSSSVLWLRFELLAETSNDYILHIPYPLLDYLDNYSFIDGVPLEPVHTGDALVFDSRAVDHINFVFPYSLNKGQKLTVYFRVDSQGTLDVPMRFLSKDEFLKNNDNETYFRGFVMGILWLMLFYNLFIFLSIKDHVYGFYVLNIFSYLASSNAYDGGAFQLLWPNYPMLNAYIFPIFNGLTQVTSIVFMLVLLQVLEKKTWYRSYFLGLLAIVSTFPVLGAILPYSTIVPIQVVFSLVVYSSALYLGIYLSTKGNRTALYFTVAMALFMVGLVSSNLKALGLLPTNFFTQHAFQLGFFIDMVVLSLALAQKIEIARKERSLAQRESIKNLKRYQDLYSESLSGNFQVTADGRLVSVNTAFSQVLGFDSNEELMLSNIAGNISSISVNPNLANELLTLLHDRDRVVDFEQQVYGKGGKWSWVSISMRPIKSESGYIEFYEGSVIDISERKENEILREQALKDKMLTLEQLVVGICHELNTPLGTSITALSYMKKLITEIQQSHDGVEMTVDSLWESLEEGLEVVELTETNLARVRDLIHQFKHVSVTQLGYQVGPVHVCSSIDSGLMTLQCRLDNMGVDVVIDCPLDLQLNNYSDAISEISHQLVENSLDHAFINIEKKNINFKVCLKGDVLEMQYSDNGCGLSEQGKSDLFNPFYTTMRGFEGKIGLGMYLTFNLVTQLLQGDVVVEQTKQGFSLLLTFPANIE
jgi:PAS domain S-box-containing protein